MFEGHSNRKTHPYEPCHVSEVDSGPQGPTSTEYKRHPVYSRSEWLLESGASILSLGLLIGIVCIFWYMDDEPLSKWRPRVSLNATIAIMSTGCTAALMFGVSEFIGQLKWLHFKNGPQKLSHLEKFDDASRGAWGSIVLLTTVKWNLATIGAVITILRLTFAPFAQQVVQIEQRDIISPNIDDSVTFGYAHRYFRGLTRELANSRVESIPQDPKMQSAVVQGLYGISTPATFSCPGVCDWTGRYISLGFKSECRNVTQETLRSETCIQRDETFDLEHCNMTTPGGLVISTQNWITDRATSYSMNATSMLGDPDALPEITRFAIYRSTPNYNFISENINITECSLSLTAYEYIDAKANGSEFSFVKTQEVDFGVKNPWTQTLAQVDGDPYGQLSTNESKADNIPALQISRTDLLALENFFESQTIVTEWVEGNVFNRNLGLAAALAGDVNIDERFEKMAASMTDYLRYGPNSQTARGRRVESLPYVSIRWPYFIAPIATEVLAILFAVLTILSNRKSRQVPLWKSSTLAVLACQHDKQLGTLQSTVKDIKEIKASAEKAEVRLQ